MGLMDIDLSAAIRPAGIPMVGDWTQSVFGVYGGATSKFARFVSEMGIGEYARAFEAISPVVAENIFKGYRLMEEGALSPSKNPKYNKQGEIFKLSPGYAVTQAMGFKNLEYSNIMQDDWEKRTIVDHYNKEKSKIVKQQHLAKTPEAMEKVMTKMMDFNISIPPYLYGVVSPVKWVKPTKPDKGMNRLRWAMNME
jgi:hypothetical protein